MFLVVFAECPIDPLQLGTSTLVTASFSDGGLLDTHEAFWDWDDGTTSTGMVSSSGGVGQVSGTHTYDQPGVYEIGITVIDDDGGSGEAAYQYVVVYDPDGGFVTGGGKINAGLGSYRLDPALQGPANFGFVAKYHKVTKLPMGQTEFQFKIGDLIFHSDSYDWLVVNQNMANAQFKGTGAINGELAPNGAFYRFMIWASDTEPDTFRIKIWWEQNDTEMVIFDNGFDQPISSGNITIHAR